MWLLRIAENPLKKVRANVYLSQEHKINPTDFWRAVEQCEERFIEKPQILPIEARLANPKKLEWLVDDLIVTPGFSIIAGAPKSGKSCCIRWLLYCIATGREFWGRPVRQGAVIYHATEEPEAIIDTEFLKMINAFGAPPPGFLNVCSGPVVVGTFREDLAVALQQYKPVLTVVDTLFDVIALEETPFLM
jgi:RecA-family ATPase